MKASFVALMYLCEKGGQTEWQRLSVHCGCSLWAMSVELETFLGEWKDRLRSWKTRNRQNTLLQLIEHGSISCLSSPCFSTSVVFGSGGMTLILELEGWRKLSLLGWVNPRVGLPVRQRMWCGFACARQWKWSNQKKAQLLRGFTILYMENIHHVQQVGVTFYGWLSTVFAQTFHTGLYIAETIQPRLKTQCCAWGLRIFANTSQRLKTEVASEFVCIQHHSTTTPTLASLVEKNDTSLPSTREEPAGGGEMWTQWPEDSWRIPPDDHGRKGGLK